LRAERERVPVVLYVHGGGKGCKDHDIERHRSAIDQYTARGVAYVFIYYRCAAEKYYYKDNKTGATLPE